MANQYRITKSLLFAEFIKIDHISGLISENFTSLHFFGKKFLAE